MGNSNQKTGTATNVEAICNLKDIEAIKEVLAGNPRNLALFTIGINTSLRAAELVEITAGQVRNLEEGGSVLVKAENARKGRKITLNRSSVKAIRAFVDTENLRDEDKLFQSQRGGPLGAASVDRLARDWCDAVNLKGNYGADSLRKTWRYHQAG